MALRGSQEVSEVLLHTLLTILFLLSFVVLNYGVLRTIYGGDIQWRAYEKLFVFGGVLTYPALLLWVVWMSWVVRHDIPKSNYDMN